MIESNQKAVDQLNKMKNVETLTSATLFVGNNQIRLKSTGHVAALIMRYKGHFKGISRSMPNNSRIIRTEKEIIYIARSIESKQKIICSRKRFPC